MCVLLQIPLEQALLQAVANTGNGKSATPSRQLDVLQIVQRLEQSFPVTTISDATIASQLNGTWYLHYTSPSVIADKLNSNQSEKVDGNGTTAAAAAISTVWTPILASEGPSNIETRPFSAQGTVSAAGIVVDTSNRLVQQIFDMDQSTVTNIVYLSNQQPDPSSSDNGSVVTVSGTFRPSSTVPNRAIVAFDTARIQVALLGNRRPIATLNLDFVFDVLARIRRSRDNGWLETTYLSESLRIGRGNKGTMFVLSRDPNAVPP
jgi:PAP_fibrillin